MRRRRPGVEIRLTPSVLRPGDILDVDARFLSKAPTPVDGITLSLRGGERGRHTIGKSTLVVEHTWVALEARFEPVSLTPGTHRYRARFPLPRSLPPSCQGSGVQVEYLLRVEVDIPWWPDVDTRYAVVVAPPAVIPSAAPWVFRSHEGEVHDRALHAECSLGSTDIAPGGTLLGRVSLGNLRHHRVHGVEAAFVATEWIVSNGRTYRALVCRYSARLADAAPSEAEPLTFRVRLPSEAPYSFEGAVSGLVWHLEIAARHTLSKTVLLSIPLRVVPRVGDGPEDDRGVAVVGRARRAHLWSEVAERAGMHHDPEADILRATIGPVAVSVFAEDRPSVGTRTVARLTLPSLGLDLGLGPARWADFFGTRRPLGDPAFDDALRLTGRDLRQLQGLLTPHLRGLLVRFAEVSLDDTGGTLSIPGAGVDPDSMNTFVAQVMAVAASLAEASERIPVPAPLGPHANAWRAYAARVGGRFEPGRGWIHDARYGTERFELGHRWGDADTVEDTVLRLRFDETVGAMGLPAQGLEGLASAAQELVTALQADGSLHLGPDGLVWETSALTPDPQSLEPTLDRLARLARALRGQREGAVFR